MAEGKNVNDKVYREANAARLGFASGVRMSSNFSLGLDVLENIGITGGLLAEWRLQCSIARRKSARLRLRALR